MAYVPTNGLPFIEEEAATGEVAEIYAYMKRELQLPLVPNLVKPIAASPEMLKFFVDIWVSSEDAYTLPHSLVAMINYTISTVSECTYCSSSHELSCRTLGIDQETLDKLVKDLPNLNPERIQAIIEFALKVAKHPQELVREDFDRLRAQGVTEGEIIEIIITAAYSVFLDIVADALQIDVDNMIAQALDQMR